MPQARRSGSSSGSGSSSSRSTTKRSAGSAGAGKSRAGAGRSSGGAKAASRGRAGAAKSGASKSGATRTSGARASSARSGTARSSTARSSSATPDARLEAVAQRLRKLNERIIDAGREAGETTLTSYEKVLKAIASAIERVPGSSDVEWLSNLSTTQAKFIRDMAETWTAAARKAIK